MNVGVSGPHRRARTLGWWSTKVRQFRRHVFARVAAGEREALTAWLTPAQLGLFDAMHPADRRHGLDVVATLRERGVRETDVLVAGLLHDCGKGTEVGLWARVAWSLSEAFGPWVLIAARRLPGFGPAIERLRDHASVSAELAAAAGCSPRAVALIREQEAPTDEEYGELFHFADEAN